MEIRIVESLGKGSSVSAGVSAARVLGRKNYQMQRMVVRPKVIVQKFRPAMARGPVRAPNNRRQQMIQKVRKSLTRANKAKNVQKRRISSPIKKSPLKKT